MIFKRNFKLIITFRKIIGRNAEKKHSIDLENGYQMLFSRFCTDHFTKNHDQFKNYLKNQNCKNSLKITIKKTPCSGVACSGFDNCWLFVPHLQQNEWHFCRTGLLELFFLLWIVSLLFFYVFFVTVFSLLFHCVFSVFSRIFRLPLKT